MAGNTESVSPQLAAALRTFSRFLESDDVARSKQIGESDVEELTTLADAVDPLYEEINEVLDRLVAKPHPVSEDEERLEEDLNSLAQAAMEARLERNRRSG
jgi:phosphate uptake regulator